MARNSLTAFLHPENGKHIISIYKGHLGSYVSTDYSYPYKLFGLGFEEEEVTIAPKPLVTWSE